MISSFVGIASVALPSCIITAAFVKELNSDDSVNFDGLYLYDNSNKHDDRGGCEGCDKYDSCDKSSDE
jgi:hypothetical protein